MREVGLEAEDDKEIEKQEEGKAVFVQKKSGGLAAFLSAIIPGLGQIYGGRGMRGAGVFLLNFVLLFSFGSASSETPNSDGTGFLFLLVVIAWLWNIFDARKIARNLQ